jgi:endonuclease/exonuclease/phosphatase (EEP) superfamily protein YafD
LRLERTGAGRHWLIWAAVAPIATWATVRILGVEGGFPLVPLLAYTPYVAFAAVLVAGVAVALRNWAAAAVSALALACLLTAVLPRAFGSGERMPAGSAELRVLSANIAFGGADAARLVEQVQALDADLLSVQELTPRFAIELKRAGIDRLLPEQVLSLRYGKGGGGLYSSLPMRQLPAPNVKGSAFRMPRALIAVDGRAVRVVDVHPFPPKRGMVALWREQLATLPAAEPSAPAPWVLAGDFNATLDFGELRDLIDTGYRDAGDVTGGGLEPTWPSGRVLPPPVTIDHVLADERVAILEYEVEDLAGSDHRAVFARLAVP